MKKQIFSLLTAMCMLVGLFAPCGVMAADVVSSLFKEEFNYTVGSNISAASGWALANDTTEVTSLIANDPTDSTNSVLDINVLSEDSSSNKYAKFSKDIYTEWKNYLMLSQRVMFTTSTKNVFRFNVEGRMRTDSTTSDREALLLMQFSYNFNTGYFVHQPESGEENVAKIDVIPLNEWVDMKFIFNITEQSYDVYMNDIKINASPLPVYKKVSGKKIEGIKSITVGSYKYGRSAAHMYVDDIAVEEFSDINTVTVPMAQSRLAKMESELTAYTLSGQKYVTKDFTPALSYLQSDDTVEITCADSAFSYNADENKVIITQGTEDKIADVKVKVTSTAGNNIEKDLKVYIPSVSDIILEEYMNHSSKIGQSISGTNNWSFDASKGELNSDGSTFKVVTSPDDNTDLVLDVNVTKQFSATNNPYITWDKTTETDGNTVVQANFKFDNDAQNNWQWNVNGAFGESLDRDTLAELTFNRKDGKITAATSNGTVTVSETILPTNQWFNVKLVINSKARTYDVYIDNVKVNSVPVGYKTTRTGELKKMRQMYFGAHRSTYNAGHMYIDDIIIRDLKPAYEIAGLTFEGSVATLAVTKYTEENIANAKAIVAVYDKETGKLIKASSPVAVNSTGNVTIEGMELPANSKACAFIWKMDNLVPLATMFEN